jgi:methylmalonyl-CoA/ethylmalonyl-CoA epimerase
MTEQRVRIVFASRGESRIELLAPTDAESGVARFVAERGRATMHHVCFEVDDIASSLERLASAGVELVDRTPRRGVEGLVAFLHPRAADGVLVELIEPRR